MIRNKPVSKAVISAVASDGSTFTVKFYNASGSPFTITTELVTAFVYGSEFKKGDYGMDGSLEAQDQFFDVKPIIIKDKYNIVFTCEYESFPC